jgi:glucose-1-phosphatase
MKTLVRDHRKVSARPASVPSREDASQLEFLPDLTSLGRRMRNDKRSVEREEVKRAGRGAKPKVEAIIFDIGRVIVRLEPKRALAALMGAGRQGGKEAGKKKATAGFSRSAKAALLRNSKRGAKGPSAAPQREFVAEETANSMWAAIQRDPLWHDWQEGRVTAREWHAHVCKRFGLKIGFEDFCRAWNNVIAPELILPERLFTRLARRVKLVLLSNTDEIHVAHMERAFGFPRRFDARVYSCEVGASKPGRKIFQAALRAAGTRPENALFVDDVKSYVLAARKVGMDGVVFRNRGQLEGELRKRKLL